MRDEGDLFEQFTHTVQCVRHLERVTEVKHCVCVFYMKCIILKVLSMTGRSDLCECMLILKGACEYFWRWLNDRVPRMSFCMFRSEN